MSKKPPRRSPPGTPPPGQLPPKKPHGTSPLLNPLSGTVPYSHVKPVKPPISKPKKTTQPPLKPLKPKKKISILYIISTTHIGGGETALKRLLKNIDPDYYQTEVLVTGQKGPLDEEYKLFSGGINYLEEQDLETVLIRRLKTGKYDYVHFFNLFSI